MESFLIACLILVLVVRWIYLRDRLQAIEARIDSLAMLVARPEATPRSAPRPVMAPPPAPVPEPSPPPPPEEQVLAPEPAPIVLEPVSSTVQGQAAQDRRRRDQAAQGYWPGAGGHCQAPRHRPSERVPSAGDLTQGPGVSTEGTRRDNGQPSGAG